VPDINEPPVLTMEEGVEPPLPFEEFKHEIDTRGGYLQSLAKSVNCFEQEITHAVQQRQTEGFMIVEHFKRKPESKQDQGQRHLLQTSYCCQIKK
jgi:hypothetical protein